MLSESMVSLSIAVMVMLSVGGVAWVFIYPLLSGERRAEKRVKTLTTRRPVSSPAVNGLSYTSPSPRDRTRARTPASA